YLFSVVTPIFTEVIIYPFSNETIDEYDGINAPYKTGHTLLTYFIYTYTNRWTNFVNYVERSGKYSTADINALKNLNMGQQLAIEDQNLQMEVRLWVSYQFQPL